MHGVRRGLRMSESQRKEALAKCKRFQENTEALMKRREEGELSETVFKLTTDVLFENAEFYTAWNIRREYVMQSREEE
eukprot:CAMPEP_0119119432 /NCGR_PEP_ID=MMETSP1310-20130426/930_1 /TAXON_ID=464262 /ORGANISM="Genus nov. species nov., Strain RCC2339" /LENGTH=77 /DNA_ID=CAMNT_0007108871 /DNA_START=98 /DNA_END=328 /DNA_ORIENTATION=-